jgi:hypothetical protein
MSHIQLGIWYPLKTRRTCATFTCSKRARWSRMILPTITRNGWSYAPAFDLVCGEHKRSLIKRGL